MERILPPIDQASKVANFQEAMLFIVEKRQLTLEHLNFDGWRHALSGPNGELTTKTFGERSKKLYAALLAALQIPPVDSVTSDIADRINNVLESHGAFGGAPAEENSTFTVEGTVVSRSRPGVGGLRVEIVDKNVCGEAGGDVPVARTVTKDDGAYRVTFRISDLHQRGKEKPDLQACAFVRQHVADQEPLGRSELRYNASNRETGLNILLSADASKSLPSEHDTLIGALSSNFKGNLGDLKETDECQDVTYLANKTGWDARAVAMAALAEQLSALSANATSDRIEPPFFYALFRAGVPANDDALYATDTKTVADIWKQAFDRDVISSRLRPRLPHALERFHRLATERALDGPAFAGASTLKEMLSVSLGDAPVKHRQFAEIYTRHRSDPEQFWIMVRAALGETAEKRLRIDGRLASLTVNNAPLMRKLHAGAGPNGVTDLVNLVSSGLYQAEKWRQLFGDDPIPREIPGASEDEKHRRYAELLAAQVRLTFPTMVIAQMVKNGETPVAASHRDQVHAFLAAHHGKFEIGTQSVQRYIARNQLQVPEEVAREITRIHRVHQITPSDTAMNALLKKGVDSSLAVARYDRERFVRTFKDDVGGEANARVTHAKAQQVHNVVLNVATSYLVARTAPQIGAHSKPKYGNPTPDKIQMAQDASSANIHKWLDNWASESPDNAGDVIPYATLESLFGEMDYCACEHCGSVLSPAAYLVDLLQFLDRKDEPANKNPLNILLNRRPDIEHLPLTCENTNTPVPYIDLVNETLEYYVTNKLSLATYEGHSTDGSIKPEELLACPQFVQDTAYDILAGKHKPGDPSPLLPPTEPLPFHQPLENLRRYFDRFETALPEVMEVLRTSDELDRPDPTDPENQVEYGWRDILMEELRLSRAEHALLVDQTISLQRLYGYDETDWSEKQVLVGKNGAPGLCNAKAFARRMEMSYEEIVEILKTRFVNPNSILVPKLEELGVPFPMLKALKEGTLSADDEVKFKEIISTVEPSHFGGDIKAWITGEGNYASIMGLITLTDPTGENNACSFDKVEFRYALPVGPNDPNPANRLRSFEFYRLIRFIRLWKKLGWTIEQTDKAIAALYPESQNPNSSDDAENLKRLEQGLLIMLPRLGVVKRLMKILKLKPKRDLLPLLACFSPIDTHGTACLYRQMFLSPAPPEENSPFVDDGFGNYLTKGEKLSTHVEAVRAALLLTDDELSQVMAFLEDTALPKADSIADITLLKLDTVSAIFRRGWLARKLKLSIREFLLLIKITGIDPFAPPDLADPPTDPVHPPILRLIDFVNRLRAVSLKPEQVLFLIWNQDISGKSAPQSGEILDFARTLRAAFNAVESEFALIDDPNGQIARAKMALVYGSDATNFFFSLLDNTLVSEVHYDHDQDTLEQAILDAAPGRIAYDDFAKRLSYAGVMTEDAINKLKVGVPLTFENAVDSLYQENQKIIAPFFDRYPELLPLYSGYVASNESAEKRRSDLLASFLPELKRRRKRQQALAMVNAVAKADITLASALLDDQTVLNPAAFAEDPALINAPALDDLAALESTGLSVKLFSGPTVSAPEIQPQNNVEDNLVYPDTGEGSLPANPAAGIWSGYIEAPENGLYNVSIEPGGANGVGPATAILTLNGEDKPLEKNGEVWSNTTPIELRAGTLYPFTLTAENITAGLKVRWGTKGRGREEIPPGYLYPATLIGYLRTTYIRFLKTASLAAGLKLAASEMAYFATKVAYNIDSQAWLNSLPVTGTPDAITSFALLKAFEALLDFAMLKAKLAPNDERLLAALKDPDATIETTVETPEGDKKNLLLALTRWDGASLDSLLLRFGKHLPGEPDQADRGALKDLGTFLRVYRAFGPVKAIGISASALVVASTNEPRADAVRSFKSALRARYEESDWLNVLKPINDEMRSLQRDALVGYVLHQMRADPKSEHIDTPEKLFEYFLMDVQMEPCMQTSRVRHALSSVQLFAERCFMNLETGVEPSVFEPKQRKQWEWKKRYRVWEANRKIFLWPENWVEPELRLDQSPPFKEALSELLQSDITEARAATALLNYLSKLEELAKLEPCGIHFVEGETGTADDVAHVVARTAGANRKYFHRRYESGLWTPWEQIKVDIEDNPVIPVVWKDRLFLFWLRILKKASGASQQGPPAGKITDLTTDQIPANTTITVQSVLCWSEYYNGKWQPTKTSDVNKPLFMQTLAQDEFRRSTLLLATVEKDDVLRLEIVREGVVKTNFDLYNTHSLPNGGFPGWEYKVTRLLDTGTFGDKLTITYCDDKAGNLTQHILKTSFSGRTVQPEHNIQDLWAAPFFYEDGHHVFYVATEKAWIVQSGYAGDKSWMKHEIPQLIPEKAYGPPILDEYVQMQQGLDGLAVLTSPLAFQRNGKNDYITKQIAMGGTVGFGFKEIGKFGSVPDRATQKL